MNKCSLKALLDGLPVRTLPAINTAHWLKCDPGQHKNMSKCTKFTQNAQLSPGQTVEQHNPRFEERRKSSKLS